MLITADFGELVQYATQVAQLMIELKAPERLRTGQIFNAISLLFEDSNLHPVVIEKIVTLGVLEAMKQLAMKHLSDESKERE
jgi:hypothetical protein